MQAYFREFQRLAAAGTYEALGQRPVPKPEFFNWTADIVEGLHLAAHPDQPAPVLANDAGSRTLSYAELLGQANQLLNYWRQQGVRQHAAVLLVPVCAELPKTISGKIRRVELRARPAGGAGEFGHAQLGLVLS